MERNNKGQFIKGLIPWNKDKKVESISKENHWNWQGGKPKCKDCGRQLTNQNTLRCQECYIIYAKTNLSGKNSPTWKGGLPKCIDCGKEIGGNHYDRKRCKDCLIIFFKDKNAPNWKDGRTKNKEYKKELNKKWSLENPERRQHLDHMRRIRKKGAEGSHTLEQWQELKKKYDYMCLCCKKQEPEIKLTQDHIIPLIKGGTDYINNIQPLCLSCNSIKYTKIINYIDYIISFNQEKILC